MKWKYLMSSLNMGYPVILIIVHMMGNYINRIPETMIHVPKIMFHAANGFWGKFLICSRCEENF